MRWFVCKLGAKNCMMLSFFICFSLAAMAQNQKISGQVLDENSKPLVGVSVNEKGTSNSTSTDEKGVFTIMLTGSKNVLIFTFIGYASTERSVKDGGELMLKMEPNYKTGEEVIVSGYGTTVRKKLTTSAVKVKGDELVKTSATTIEQALQGQAAGVSVVTNDGNPGGKANVRIRGFSSASVDGNNDPLYVIDGVPTKGNSNVISLLNSGNIESVDILKDASATAIYGIQAANGVIVVTTKKGKLNSKMNFTLNTYAGVAKAWKKLDVLNPQEYARAVNTQVANQNELNVIIGNPLLDIDGFLANPAQLPVKGTNWQDLIFNNGHVYDVSLNANGGSDKTTYSLGLGYRNQEGIIINSNIKRYNFQSGFNHQLTDKIKIGGNISYNYAERNGVPYNYIYGTSLSNAVLYPNLYPSKNPDGTYRILPAGVKLYYETTHPVAVSESIYSPSRETGIWGSVFADVKILKNLTYHTQFGYNRSMNQGKGSSEPTLRDSTYSSPESVISNRSVYLYQSDFRFYNWDNYLTYNLSFLDKHNLTLTTGTVYQSSESNGYGIGQQGFNSFDLRYRYVGLGNNPIVLSTNEYLNQKTQFSYFGRVNYDYGGKYLMQFSLRRDGSSVFSNTNNHYGTFPAASAAWRISEEEFISKNRGIINELKLRASWGKTGNDEVGDNYAGFSRIGPGYGYALDGNVQPGVALSVLGNPNLQWEIITQTDIGLDITLFNKFDITLDWYKRKNDNMLIRSPISGMLGLVSPPAANVGAMENTGFEFSLNYKTFLSKNLNISVGFNGSTLKNKVLSLGNGVPFLLPLSTTYATQDYVSRTIPGQSLGSFYGYVFDGIYQNQSEIDKGPTYAFQSQNLIRPGDMRLKDLNGDGEVNADDRTVLGSPIPKFTWGFNLKLEYKNFDLSTLVSGSHGNKIFSDVYHTLMSRTYAGNKLGDYRNSWTPENHSTTVPRAVYEINPVQSVVSSWYVFDGSFVRVRNITAGYNFKAPWLSKGGITSARLYFNVQNPFTFTKYWGWDPEIGANEDGNVNRDVYLGVDFGAYPQARTYMVGLNVTF